MSDLARYKTAAQWVSQNPVLPVGVPGFEDDTGKLKIGNGTQPWLSLSYVDTPPYVLPRPEYSFGGGEVKTVAGRKGNVTLTASDISGTFADNQIPPSIARDSEVSTAISAATSSSVSSAEIRTIKALTQAAYDALNPKDSTTLYVVTG